ncbi:MAG: PilZ domain [Verrucomicrobiaceae bacterium]|nr:PilZ domain [Verrucomicrobiaceae bacterium]
MSKERRVHNRIEVNWSARIGGRGLGIAPAKVKDASIGGIYLITTLHVELGDMVIVELEISSDGPPALVNSKIARKDPLPGDKLFGYGLQFLHLDDDVLQYLLTACS